MADAARTDAADSLFDFHQWGIATNKPGFDGEWVRAKLLDVCDFRGGTQPPKSEWIKEPRPGYVRMLQIRDYSQDSLKYAEYVKDSSSLHKCEKTDIMLSRYGYIGQVFTGLEGAYNVALVKVVKKVSADTRYLFYYFESDYFKKTLLASTGSRATIQGFNKSELANAEINLPDKTTQRRIPKILELLDSLIEISNKIVLLLDDLVKSQFVEMFGDPIANSHDLPLSKWSDVLAIRNGRNQKTVECDGGKFPICGSGGEMGRASSFITKGDSVIIGRKGNINNPILMREPFWNVDTAFGLEPNNKVLTVEYLYNFCKWFDFEKLNKAVTIPSLTKADLLKLDMPLPPLPLQQQFADFVAQVDKLRFDPKSRELH